MKDFMEYSCGKMEQGTWISSSRFLLNQLQEEGCNYPKYQMYEAYLCHVGRRRTGKGNPAQI